MDRSKISEIRNRAKGASAGKMTSEARDGAHVITASSRSHVQFLEKGPADVEGLLDHIAALERRVAVLEAHLKTFEDVLKERDALRAEKRTTRPAPPQPIEAPK